MSFSFEAKRPEYSRRLKAMNINPGDEKRVTAAARRCIAGRERYERVERATGVPWLFVAVLHYRESSNDFRGVLHNGEKILGTGRRTTLVPKGRGPFSTWEEAAVDALKIKGLDGGMDWSLERVAFEAERFNGRGYHNMGRPSPYLWSGTNQYVSGKYVRDHVYDPTEKDRQLGVLPIYFRAKELLQSPDTVIPSPPPAKPEAVKQVGVLRTLAVWLKALFAAVAGLFSLDNLTSVREWLGVVSEYFSTQLLAGALIGMGLLWLITEALERAKHSEALEKDNE